MKTQQCRALHTLGQSGHLQEAGTVRTLSLPGSFKTEDKAFPKAPGKAGHGGTSLRFCTEAEVNSKPA